jgi:thymidylate kinase
MIVAISGIDGAGKTTQIEALLNYFNQKRNRAIRLWSRGGYTPVYNILKSILRFFLGKKLPSPGKTAQREKMLNTGKIGKLWLAIAIIDLMLYYGMYMRLLSVLFRKTVIADRYLIDTYIDFRINFSSVRFYKWKLWKLLVFVTPKPSHSFLLAIPLKEAEKRAAAKNEPYPDSDKVRILRYRYYQKCAKMMVQIDCLQNIESVTGQLIRIIES